ncbi:hypothetical protein MZO44_16505, partial [Lactiplantibacillus sp. E932]|uniref:hypothetical protein n=1 Tax=Lactiplantibacillus plantarum TaxID=1590 RepID=UPI00207730D6
RRPPAPLCRPSNTRMVLFGPVFTKRDTVKKEKVNKDRKTETRTRKKDDIQMFCQVEKLNLDLDYIKKNRKKIEKEKPFNFENSKTFLSFYSS